MRLRVAHGADFVEVEGDGAFCAEVVGVWRAFRARYYDEMHQRQAAELSVQEKRQRNERVSAAISTVRTFAPHLLRRGMR